jgi:dTDP-4-amino-4,6-dideoxygalactose transaminase
MTTATRKIPPLRLWFPEEDRKEIHQRIERCLAEGQVAQGSNVREFEERFAEYCGCRYALAVSSGGAALEVAMWALDVRGKEVLVPTNTFLATAAAVLLAGGQVKLVDIDPRTAAPNLDILRRSVSSRTAGVIMVHIGGIISPEIEAIRDWCSSRGLWLFEDCAHAHGSELNGKRAGTFGIGGAYSFFSTKVMTCGEGGMVVSDDQSLAKKVALLRNYGKPEPWVTYSTELGANWRLNELAAAVGVVQLKRLDEMIRWREGIAALYTSRLQSLEGVQPILPHGRSSWYKYIILLPQGVDREKFKGAAKERGVAFAGGVYDLPLHRQPVFAGTPPDHFQGAEEFCSRHVCLPIYYGMTREEAEYVVEVLRAIL